MSADDVIRAVPGIPQGPEGPIFREPWEAQAFAITLALHARRLFTWAEWTEVLSEEIGRAQATGDADTGETYYHHWLAALERIVTEKGVADAASLARCHGAWRRAAERTPHGSPVVVTAEDFTSEALEQDFC